MKVILVSLAVIVSFILSGIILIETGHHSGAAFMFLSSVAVMATTAWFS